MDSLAALSGKENSQSDIHYNIDINVGGDAYGKVLGKNSRAMYFITCSMLGVVGGRERKVS